MKSSNAVKKNVPIKIFSALVCAVAFALIVTMADLFSSLITVGGFSVVSDNITLGEYRVYAVCTANYKTKLLASEFCETIKSQGGAGILYMTNNEFYLVASMYDNETDAKKVLANIVDSKPEASIQTIVIPQIAISNNLSTQEKNTLGSCLGVFKNSYKKLYDISVSLDTVVISEVEARLAINELVSSAQTALGNFNTIFANSATTSLLKIRLGLEDAIKELTTLSNSTEAYPLTSLVKACYSNIILIYKNVAEQF